MGAEASLFQGYNIISLVAGWMMTGKVMMIEMKNVGYKSIGEFQLLFLPKAC